MNVKTGQKYLEQKEYISRFSLICACKVNDAKQIFGIGLLPRLWTVEFEQKFLF